MGAILREGWEAGDLSSAGWSSGLNVATTISGMDARKDFNGNGGDYLLYGNSTIHKYLKREAREVFIRWHHASTRLDRNDHEILFMNDSTQHGAIEINRIVAVLATMGIKAPNNTVRDTTAPIMPNTGRWVEFAARMYIHDTNGYLYLYQDGDLVAKVGEWDGDTKNGATETVNRIGIKMSTSFATGACDDVAINDITMSYTSGSGTLPAVDDIITGQTSATTAIITAILPGSTNVAGTLQLAYIEDSGSTLWNGIMEDDLFDTETIDDSASSDLWSADITGLDTNSGLPKNAYIIGLTPNGDVAGKIQLTAATGPSNYQDVDEVVAVDTDYVSTSTDGERDIYEVTNLPFTAADVTKITAVSTSVRWTKTDETLTKGRIMIEDSSTEYESDQISLTSSFAGDTEIYNEVPGGGGEWTHAKINSIRVGVKFET